MSLYEFLFEDPGMRKSSLRAKIRVPRRRYSARNLRERRIFFRVHLTTLLVPYCEWLSVYYDVSCATNLKY